MQFNNAHMEKLCFTQFSTGLAAWLLLNFFIRLQFTQSVKYISLSRIKEYRCLKNGIYQIDSKSEWYLLSASVTAKFGLVFVFLRGFILKPTKGV